MLKSEETDLFELISSLKSFEIKAVKRYVESSNLSDKKLVFHVFEIIRRQRVYDKVELCKKLKVEEFEVAKIKHKIFLVILQALKSILVKDASQELIDLMLELDLLMKHGMFYKANRKLDKIVSIGELRCEYDICLWAIKKAIRQGLFAHVSFKHTHLMDSAYAKIKSLEEKSLELNAYENLSDQVLLLHYEFLDRRIENRNEILRFLEHPLLLGKKKFHSILSEFYYYRIKSIVYLGDNNYVESRIHSLKALAYIKSVKNKNRDDFSKTFNSINNYLDASLHLEDTTAYNEMIGKMDQLIEEGRSSLSLANKAIAFQMRLSCNLNYLWLIKDHNTFIKNFENYRQIYLDCAPFYRPNIAAEILLGFSKLFFLAKAYDQAHNYCLELMDTQKKNPTTLILCCCNILRVIINYELGNLQAINYIIQSSKYFLKTRNRYFAIEGIFFSGLSKVKSYQSSSEKLKLFQNLHSSLSKVSAQSEERVVDKMIGLTDWVAQKASGTKVSEK